jgi:hypothetical protein
MAHPVSQMAADGGPSGGAAGSRNSVLHGMFCCKTSRSTLVCQTPGARPYKVVSGCGSSINSNPVTFSLGFMHKGVILSRGLGPSG